MRQERCTGSAQQFAPSVWALRVRVAHAALRFAVTQTGADETDMPASPSVRVRVNDGLSRVPSCVGSAVATALEAPPVPQWSPSFLKNAVLAESTPKDAPSRRTAGTGLSGHHSQGQHGLGSVQAALPAGPVADAASGAPSPRAAAAPAPANTPSAHVSFVASLSVPSKLFGVDAVSPPACGTVSDTE